MGLGYYVDSEPADHLSPQAEGVIVDHLLCPARTPVLKHAASPCPAGRMDFYITRGHCPMIQGKIIKLEQHDICG
jgi:hypothetical protein